MFKLCVTSSASHQVSDLLHVAAALKEQAAHVDDLRSEPTSSVSHGSKTERREISEIWMNIYSSASLTQARISQFSALRPENNKKKQQILFCAAILKDIILKKSIFLVRKQLDQETSIRTV